MELVVFLAFITQRALPSQYSSGEIILRGGGDSIIAGWTMSQLLLHFMVPVNVTLFN